MTIFALASGAGRGAVAVLRLSGDGTRRCLTALCHGVPAPRRASLRTLRDGSGAALDRGLVLWLPGPASYTGEDSAELHLHGGRAVIRAVSDALLSLGCRPAEPGEFSRRAFLNGRFDLLEAEGVADLVAAETEGQRRQALRQLGGESSGKLAAWSERLRRVLAWQEALIDFPDEDLPARVEAQLHDEIHALTDAFRLARADAAQGARVRDGLVFSIVGPPNVGKSSLLNALSGREAAIVAASAGTTRDVLEVPLILSGLEVILVDTAGLRETLDPVEMEGVRRARQRLATADLVMFVTDSAAPHAVERPAGALWVANKTDLAPAPEGALGVSAATGAGLATLRSVLSDEAVRLTATRGDVVLSRARHIAAISEAEAALQRAEAAKLPELRGEELRLALRALGRITGQVDVEAVLDVVFSAFCIGK